MPERSLLAFFHCYADTVMAIKRREKSQRGKKAAAASEECAAGERTTNGRIMHLILRVENGSSGALKKKEMSSDAKSKK